MNSSDPLRPSSMPEDPRPASPVALRYHELTKHTTESVRRGSRGLDWANQPAPYKRYRDLPEQMLPRPLAAELPPTVDLLRRLPQWERRDSSRPLSLAQLSALCHLGYGITAQKLYPGGSLELRAAPSAGALYPCELYACVSGVEGIADGVYHYGPAAHSLTCLREGDALPYLRAATGNTPALQATGVVLVVSAIWWRSSWKYRNRAYRYCLNDTGHLVGNLLLAGEALGAPATLLYDFVDGEVNRLLGLDPGREAALALVACGDGQPPVARPPSMPPLEAIAWEHRPLSAQEETYPAIQQLHAATSLAMVTERPASRAPSPEASTSWEAAGPALGLPEPAAAQSAQPLSETVARRRSTRSFARQPIAAGDLGLLLDCAASAYPHDRPSASLLEAAVIVSAGDGLPPGLYRWDAAGRRLWPLRQGDLRPWAAYLGMEQSLCGEAAASIFLLADLPSRLEEGGERAYRRVHIEAGLRGELMYLASRALGLGCSGIGAFYDDEAAEFLGAPEGVAVVYDLIVGPEAAVA